jgi:hypothetical protein
MGESEKAAQKKLQQKTTLHHAEEHRYERYYFASCRGAQV